jgi:hypothetical protein
MALLLINGFTAFNYLYPVDAYYNAYSQAATGRWGGTSLYVADWIKWVVPGAPDTVVWGFAWKAGTGNMDNMNIMLQDDRDNDQCRLKFASRVPYFQRGSTTLATASTPLLELTWYYIEIKLKVHPSAGFFDVRVNGVSIMSGTGVNTRNTANNRIGIVNWSAYGGSKIHYFDDMYLCDGSPGDFLGDTRVEYLVPTGAGVRTQFAPSTGSNYQTVDEMVVGGTDTDYNSSSSPGAMDLFTMANLSGNGLVHGVKTTVRGWKDDAGHRKVKPMFYKSMGTGDTARFYGGTALAVSDTINYLQDQIIDTSPDTGTAWTVDEVNALQYGYAVGDAGMFTLDAKLV